MSLKYVYILNQHKILNLVISVVDPDPVGSAFLPDPEISPPNPDPDPALVVFKKKISVSVQYRAYVYLFTP